MRTFTPLEVPTNAEDIPDFLRRLQDAIQKAAHRADPYAELDPLHAAPTKLRDGMVVKADGTNWEPVALGGEGFYGYTSGGWVKLG